MHHPPVSVNVKRIALPPSLGCENESFLLEDLKLAARDESVTAVVLHGGEGVFCRGLDLGGIVSAGCDGSGAKAAADTFADLLTAILFLPRPVIAEVDGEARGGGMGIAAACDVVVATRRSSFGLPETMFGLIPAIIGPALLQRITPQKLRWLALSCEAVDAERALELGLADIVIENEQLERSVQRIAHRFRHADPTAVASLKEYLGKAAGEMMWEGAAVTASFLGSDRVRSRIERFFLLTGDPSSRNL